MARLQISAIFLVPNLRFGIHPCEALLRVDGVCTFRALTAVLPSIVGRYFVFRMDIIMPGERVEFFGFRFCCAGDARTQRAKQN